MAKKQVKLNEAEQTTEEVIKDVEPETPKIKPLQEKPFNPDEEALLLFWQVEELLKKSEILQQKAAQKMNLVPTSLVVTTNRLRQCYEGMRIALGK